MKTIAKLLALAALLTAPLLAQPSGNTLPRNNPTFSGTLTGPLEVLNQPGIATTSTDALTLQNATASTSGATVQYSPRLHFVGHAWNTTATAADNYLELIEELRPASAATPTASLAWAFRRSTAGTGSFVDFGSMAPNGTGGGILLTALGTNQSITLTPSGTGFGLLQGAAASDAIFKVNAVTGQTPKYVWQKNGSDQWVNYNPNGNNNLQWDSGGSGSVLVLTGAGHLLLGGLTTDGTGVAQLPVHTTTAGGISLGTAAFLYTQVSGGRGINVSGTGTNDNAPVGYYGEYVGPALVAIGAPVSLTNNTAANVTSISLTAGDWDVTALASVTETTSTVTARIAGISTTSATLPTDGSEGYNGVQSTLTSETNSIPLNRKRISVSGTTTVYLVEKVTFSAGTAGAFGALDARRVR